PPAPGTPTETSPPRPSRCAGRRGALVGQVARPWPRMLGGQRRMPPPERGHSRAKSGGVLLSRGVYPQVPSALAGLTSGFGMGTGVTPPLWPPETCCQRGNVSHENSRASTSVSIQALGRLVPVG